MLQVYVDWKLYLLTAGHSYLQSDEGQFSGHRPAPDCAVPYCQRGKCMHCHSVHLPGQHWQNTNCLKPTENTGNGNRNSRQLDIPNRTNSSTDGTSGTQRHSFSNSRDNTVPKRSNKSNSTKWIDVGLNSDSLKYDQIKPRFGNYTNHHNPDS